ncbi:hypothetical protein [Catellatospora paridis]|uniref:hypothetical protein n=1 Tax=Catellatospora paridis TaxID=1617086 RepID=UPI0012D3A016|nr:hypothetical protein [Catellatospora paridis]
MSRRVTVNVPDEVAERLEREPNVSQYVTTAIRDRMRHEERLAATRRMLADAGYQLTAEGIERMRTRLAEHDARRTAARGREQAA